LEESLVTLHLVAESAPKTLDRLTNSWQSWSFTWWQGASLGQATALRAGAQLFEALASSATYTAQTLSVLADLLAPGGPPPSQPEERPVLVAVPDGATAPGKSDAAPDAPPVPRWDELSVGSIRAQLRRWDVDTLGALHAYEKQHGNRPAVVSMLANRIAKTRPGAK
jgi:hypothetical protein